MITVEVTKRDIKAGVPTNFFSCPLALAISRATKKSIGIAWGSKSTPTTEDPLWYPMLYRDGKWSFIHLSMEVMEWMNAFDRKHEVGPMSFELLL